jgi:hypothetical protein
VQGKSKETQAKILRFYRFIRPDPTFSMGLRAKNEKNPFASQAAPNVSADHAPPFHRQTAPGA